MSVKKVIVKSGEIKWLLDFYESGRGSKRIKKFFDRKVDAEDWEKKNRKGGVENCSPDSSCADIDGSNVDVDSDNDGDVVDADVRASEKTMRTTFLIEAQFWLDNNEASFSKAHFKRAKGIIYELLPKIGKLDPMKMNASFLTNLQRQLKSKRIDKIVGKKKVKVELSNGTVNRKMEIVVAVLNYSATLGRIKQFPGNGFKKLPLHTEEMLFWDKDEAESYLSFTNQKYPPGNENRWIYVVYLLALNTGLRAGEIWGLKPCDISSDGQTLFIRRQFNRVIKDFGPLKSKQKTKSGNKSRHVPCNPELLAELRNLIKQKQLSKDETIFHWTQRKPVDHDSFAGRFAKDQRKWGGKLIRFHDLRHTAATLLIAAGVDIMTVKEICGHEDIKTTMNYVHLIGNSVRKVGQIHLVSGKNFRDDQSKQGKQQEKQVGQQQIQTAEQLTETPLRLISN
ncbi:MAG: site-specific integrase [Oligoflexia bacterium]|nr:site-specific integrase [Oligoflexia bacterium]